MMIQTHRVDDWYSSDPWCGDTEDRSYTVRRIRGAWLRLYSFGAAAMIERGCSVLNT